ncbi:MAG TPA: phosphoribosyltransferase [Dictyoglomaceae bacterium]|nr:phosphoribosyltransferase [Dictyoglomaceae bacterium]HOL39655.1 phosphoribosyltransferase [Dictyoglomaceae bacterium]HPP15227.1 phosphoribosyltransferase [Dictyoglomaceae bacterium]
MEYIAPSWEEIYELCLDIADKIKKIRFEPEIIVGIARGGWIPARILSDLLGNSYTANLKIDFYRGVGETKEKPVITQTVSTIVEGKKILISDDVADSGKSLKVAQEHLEQCGASQVKIATIFYKPWSIVKPDFYIKETEAWIVFPWERKEFVSKMVETLKAKGFSKEEIFKEISKSGISEKLLKRFLMDIMEETL